MKKKKKKLVLLFSGQDVILCYLQDLLIDRSAFVHYNIYTDSFFSQRDLTGPKEYRDIYGSETELNRFRNKEESICQVCNESDQCFWIHVMHETIHNSIFLVFYFCVFLDNFSSDL